MAEAGATAEIAEPVYSGFWRRVFAITIDWLIIDLVVFGLVYAANLGFGPVLVPDFMIKVSTTRSKELMVPEVKQADGATTQTRRLLEEKTFYGLWTFYFVSDEQITTGADGQVKKTSSRITVDRVTGQQTPSLSSDVLWFPLMFAYFVIAEAAPWGATIGKRVLGAAVVFESGRSLTRLQSVFRALFKLLSFVTVVGVLMPIWTKRKQALHDKMLNTLVLRAGA